MKIQKDLDLLARIVPTAVVFAMLSAGFAHAAPTKPSLEKQVKRLKSDVKAIGIQVNTIKVSSGPQGPAGPKGSTGAQGAKGDKGDKGDTGLAGPQGIAGPVGPKGATGAQGAKGDKGDPGLDESTREQRLLAPEMFAVAIKNFRRFPGQIECLLSLLPDHHVDRFGGVGVQRFH